MYLPFIEKTADYIFMKGKPQKSDVIFVPGNGYPQMAEEASDCGKLAMPLISFPAADIVNRWAGFQGFWMRKGNIQGSFLQNGNF